MTNTPPPHQPKPAARPPVYLPPGSDGASPNTLFAPGYPRQQLPPAFGAGAPPPARQTRWGVTIILCLLAFGLGLLAGAAAHKAATTAASVTATPAATATKVGVATVKPTPTDKAAETIPGDGTFQVGTDVKAGTYKSGKPTSGNCYWGRLKGMNGQLDDIIANDSTAGPSVVTILATDRLFQTAGCETWTRVS